MIRFGPAGIPLSCKGRTLKDGIEDVHNLSLTALEIQMVRPGTNLIYPDEDIIGLRMKDIEDHLVVEIDRDGDLICDPEEEIEEDDVLIEMCSRITDSFGELYDIGRMAKRLDVNVSLHVPNYMDLGSNSPLTESCLDSIRHGGIITNALDGSVVVTNLGLYNGVDDIDTLDANIMENVGFLVDWWQSNGLKPKIGIEITGQEEVFGSLDQVLEVCDQFGDTVVPVINWPNYYTRSRNSGLPMDAEDEIEEFKYIIEQVEPYCDGNIHTLFSGIEYTANGGCRLTAIKKGDLKFDTLADCLVEMKPNMTIISSSPLLEHDAMYMRIIHERYLNKKVAKALRLKKKEEEGLATEE